MNRQLLDPFESDIPERIEEELYEPSRQARCLSFNKRGTLLATGCHDGSCVLWDFDTHGVIKVLQDESDVTSPAVAIAWSSNGRRIVVADDKGRVRIWDVEKGTQLHHTKFDSACLTVQFSPCDPSLLLVCPNIGHPLLIHIDGGWTRPIESAQTSEPSFTAPRSKGDMTRNYVASFDPEGLVIYVGNNKGLISLWKSPDLEKAGEIQLPSTNPVRNLQFTRDGNYFLVADTAKIRIYDAREGTLSREFLDKVDVTKWRRCSFSSEGHYVLGATAEKGEHHIHLWNRDNGQLVRKLTGPKESVLDLQWHPTRAILASCAQHGRILLWSKMYVENYSAFAPNFKELEENEEYIEREDEFDIIDEREAVKKKAEEEEVEVDVVGGAAGEAFAAAAGAEVDGDELVYLPAVPDRDPALATEVVVVEEKAPEALAGGGGGGGDVTSVKEFGPDGQVVRTRVFVTSLQPRRAAAADGTATAGGDGAGGGGSSGGGGGENSESGAAADGGSKRPRLG